VLGPAHPDTGMSYINLGALAAKLQRYDEAIELCQRGLEIYRATVDHEHPSVAMALQIMAGAHTYLGRYDEAAKLHEELVAIREKLYGSDHISLADTWSNIGAVYANQGRYEEAESAVSKALAIYDGTEAHESAVAFLHYNLGTIAFEQGQYDRAEDWFEKSLEMWSKGGNPKNSDLSYPLAAMGRIMLHRGQPRAALPYLERAHELVAPLRRSGRLAVIDFALARALWPDVDRRGRAWELVQRAHSDLADAPAFYAEDKAELDAWIEAHRAELPVATND
jgi:tetratricopeptide (TPR) repeat protein